MLRMPIVIKSCLLALVALGPSIASSQNAPLAATRAVAPRAVAPSMPPDRLTLATYGCATGETLRARYVPASSDEEGRSVVYLTIENERVRLIRIPSASGVLYIGGGWQWWTDRVAEGMLARLAPSEMATTDLGALCTLR